MDVVTYKAVKDLGESVKDLGGRIFNRTLIIGDSRDWVAPFTGKAQVVVVGGGGSGAIGSGNFYSVSGGGAGEFAADMVNIVAGHTYTLVIGAGGLTATANTPGNPGGNTSFSDNDSYTITANGGGGGAYSISVPNDVSGGTGGTGGTGGSASALRFPGGDGGDAKALNNTGGAGLLIAVGGGGSVGVFIDGANGGSATVSTTNATNTMAYAGGAGVGAAGNDAVAVSTTVNALGMSAYNWTPSVGRTVSPAVNWELNDCDIFTLKGVGVHNVVGTTMSNIAGPGAGTGGSTSQVRAGYFGGSSTASNNLGSMLGGGGAMGINGGPGAVIIRFNWSDMI